MGEFIEIVRLNPCLWKVDEKNYKNQDLRDSLWEDISKKCNIKDGNEAKRQWKKLRDSFRDALKRQNDCKSGDAARIKRSWIYQKQMEFLVPYMANRSRCSNIVDTQVNENVIETGQDDYLQTQEDLSHIDLEENKDQETPLEHNYEFVEPAKKKKCQWQDNVVSLMKQQVEKREARTAERNSQRKELEQKLQSNDPLKEFFNSMYLTTASMPQRFQIMIKRKIFDAVSEAEMNLSHTTHVTNLGSHANRENTANGYHHNLFTLQPPQQSNPVYNQSISTPLPSPQSTSTQSSGDETVASYFGGWNVRHLKYEFIIINLVVVFVITEILQLFLFPYGKINLR
ncbi:uncharacterized protein [Leptinotarsa decemlineata]|uniref:uncharacterized protein n=1 Tax=Leptinotarsa decemlineata TaxID=7539 RepID=UPI003D306930